MLTANLHVQVAFVVQWANGDGIVDGKFETFQEIEHAAYREDIKDINVDDNAGEWNIVHLAVGADASADSCDEVWCLEGENVAELLAVDRSDDARL